MQWIKPEDAQLIERLKKPTGKVKLVLDTDTFNEVDDQFAVAYALLKPDKFDILGIHAAPFFNDNSVSPEDGMEKSYQEIIHLLELMGKTELKSLVYQGSRNYLVDEETPQPSPAAEHLVQLAKELPDGEQLYVAAIGAITNVASAILLDPSIINKIVVIWLGGNALTWPTAKEFNLMQDIAADRVVFDCGVPLVQLPCMGVVTHLATTKPEMKEYMAGKNPLCDYLYKITCEDSERIFTGKCWSRVIWDVSTIAWLACDPGAMTDVLIHSPIVSYDFSYGEDPNRHFMKYVNWINRDAVFEDLFGVLAKA